MTSDQLREVVTVRLGRRLALPGWEASREIVAAGHFTLHSSLFTLPQKWCPSTRRSVKRHVHRRRKIRIAPPHSA
ncbi:MAG: hypothetical protein KY459_06935 [Acidobacteria bacterium]|nr:hypothetical protein [Acidobacteriota bacterium]